MQDQSMNQYYGTTPNGNYSIRHSNPMSYTHPPNPSQYHSSPSHSHYSSQSHSYLPSTPLPLASHQPAHELLSYLNQNPGVSSTSRPMPKDSQSILASLDQAIHSQEIQLAALKEQAQRSTLQWKQQLAMAHHHIPQYDAIGSVRHSSPAYHFSDDTLASPVSHLSPTPTLRESDVLSRHIQQSPTSALSYYPNQLSTAHQHAVPLHQHGSLMPVNPPSQSMAHPQMPTPSQLHPIPQTTDYVKIESQPVESMLPVPDATMRDIPKVPLLNDNPSVHSPPTLNRRLNMRRRSVCSAVKRQPSVSPTRHHQSDQDDNDADDHDDHDEDDEDEEDDCEVNANDRARTLAKQADGRSHTKSASSTKAKRGQGVSCHSCKTSKPQSELYFCQNRGSQAPDARKRRCRKKYCQQCLERSYLPCLPQPGAPLDTWVCPSCLCLCLCANCMRRDKGPDAVFTHKKRGSVCAPFVGPLPSHVTLPATSRHHQRNGSTSTSASSHSANEHAIDASGIGSTSTSSNCVSGLDIARVNVTSPARAVASQLCSPSSRVGVKRKNSNRSDSHSPIDHSSPSSTPMFHSPASRQFSPESTMNSSSSASMTPPLHLMSLNSPLGESAYTSDGSQTAHLPHRSIVTLTSASVSSTPSKQARLRPSQVRQMKLIHQVQHHVRKSQSDAHQNDAPVIDGNGDLNGMHGDRDEPQRKYRRSSTGSVPTSIQGRLLASFIPPINPPPPIDEVLVSLSEGINRTSGEPMSESSSASASVLKDSSNLLNEISSFDHPTRQNRSSSVPNNAYGWNEVTHLSPNPTQPPPRPTTLHRGLSVQLPVTSCFSPICSPFGSGQSSFTPLKMSFQQSPLDSATPIASRAAPVYPAPDSMTTRQETLESTRPFDIFNHADAYPSASLQMSPMGSPLNGSSSSIENDSFTGAVFLSPYQPGSHQNMMSTFPDPTFPSDSTSTPISYNRSFALQCQTGIGHISSSVIGSPTIETEFTDIMQFT